MYFSLNIPLYTQYCIYSDTTDANGKPSKDIALAVFLDYPKHLTLLIMIFCYINDVIMELEASVINVFPVNSVIINST